VTREPRLRGARNSSQIDGIESETDNLGWRLPFTEVRSRRYLAVVVFWLGDGRFELDPLVGRVPRLR
jgi:hypothetical protein